MYQRILVATDLVAPAPVATLASVLGASTGSLELITVSHARAFYDVDRADLERIAAGHGRPPAACTVLVGDDVAATILHHAELRRRSLLVIGSAGAPPWSSASPACVSRSILSTTRHPVLVVGPHVDVDVHPEPNKLVVAVDDPVPDPATIEAVRRWVLTFGCERTWLVLVGDDGDEAQSLFDAWVAAAQAANLDVVHDVVRDRDPAAALAAYAADARNAVIVTPSRRDKDGHRHLTSTTRDLIRRGHNPILVVPAHELEDTTTPDHADAGIAPTASTRP